MIQATNDLIRYKNDMLKTVKQQKINRTKTTLLHLRQKVLNRVFLKILMDLF